MPLIHSKSDAAFSENVSREIRSGRPRDQSLAIAYRIRREKHAKGGAVPTPRSLYRKPSHTGPISSVVPGRTDNHAMAVPAGSYVLPADHISALGQGNTDAGMAVAHEMFGKFGSRSGGMGKSRGMPKFADGGEVGAPVDIMAAGGEFVIPPEAVAEIGGGDIERGHSILDEWVTTNRKKHIKTLKGLPGPAKS